MVKKQNTLISLALLVIFTVSQALAESSVKTVEAEGRAEIIKGNVDSARKAAIEDALRNAVEKVGVEVVSETVVENFELVKDRIVTRAKGYVHGYKVVDEKISGNLVKVKIKADVSASDIKEDASFIYAQMNKPRVVILINEVSDGKTSPSKLVENLVTEYFLSKDFKVVDRAVVLEKISRDERRLAAEGDIAAAKKLGARVGAEVIITGTSTPGTPESVRGILYAAKSNVSLRSVKADTGELYATVSISQNGIDATPSGAVDKSLRAAAEKCAREIFWRTVKKWNAEKVRGSTIEIVITGVKFSDLSRLKAFLASLKGITEVRQRAFEKPSVVYEVVSELSAERLAELISSKSSKRLAFEVISLSQGRLHLKKK